MWTTAHLAAAAHATSPPSPAPSFSPASSRAPGTIHAAPFPSSARASPTHHFGRFCRCPAGAYLLKLSVAPVLIQRGGQHSMDVLARTFHGILLRNDSTSLSRSPLESADRCALLNSSGDHSARFATKARRYESVRSNSVIAWRCTTRYRRSPQLRTRDWPLLQISMLARPHLPWIVTAQLHAHQSSVNDVALLGIENELVVLTQCVVSM